MKPTRIKPGHRNLPLLFGAAAPEAHQRAPTLMASAGSPGEVRVWSPDMGNIRRRVCLSGASLITVIALGFTVTKVWPGSSGFIGLLYFISAMCFVIGFASLRRPCYLTTDASGIGVTTTQSSRALLWSELQSLETVETMFFKDWVLTLNSSEKLDLNLVGYPREVRDSLLELVVEKAALEYYPKRALYGRTAASLPTPEEVSPQ